MNFEEDEEYSSDAAPLLTMSRQDDPFYTIRE